MGNTASIEDFENKIVSDQHVKDQVLELICDKVPRLGELSEHILKHFCNGDYSVFMDMFERATNMTFISAAMDEKYARLLSEYNAEKMHVEDVIRCWFIYLVKRKKEEPDYVFTIDAMEFFQPHRCIGINYPDLDEFPKDKSGRRMLRTMYASLSESERGTEWGKKLISIVSI